MGLSDRSYTGFAASAVGGCAAIDRAVFGESRIGLGQLTEWQWEWLWSSVPEILRSEESEFGQRARSRNPWDRYRSEETSELVVVVVMVRGRGVKRRHSLTVLFIIVGGEGRVDFVHHHF